MDKITLLREFYRDMQWNMCKLETTDYGWKAIKAIEGMDANVDYVEFTSLIHKYRLSNVNNWLMEYFLQKHIEQKCNICMYYGEKENSLISFNLDTKIRDAKKITHEVKGMCNAIVSCLNKLDIEPLVIVSGRGYHIHCRLEKPVDNNTLLHFMIIIELWARETLKNNNISDDMVNVSKYPHREGNTCVSLRMFGSKHIKKEIFSHICTHATVLSEEDSWNYFKDYLDNGIIPIDTFDKALEYINKCCGTKEEKE